VKPGPSSAAGLLTLQRIARLVPAALLALPTLCFAADGVLILHSNQRVTPAAIIVDHSTTQPALTALAPLMFISRRLTDQLSPWATIGRGSQDDRSAHLQYTSMPKPLTPWHVPSGIRKHCEPPLPVVPHAVGPPGQIRVTLPSLHGGAPSASQV